MADPSKLPWAGGRLNLPVTHRAGLGGACGVESVPSFGVEAVLEHRPDEPCHRIGGRYGLCPLEGDECLCSVSVEPVSERAKRLFAFEGVGLLGVSLAG